MRIKNLTHWFDDYFNSAESAVVFPWVEANWNRTIEIFTKILHRHLSTRKFSNSSQKSTNTTNYDFDEIFKLFESNFGLPQFILQSDLKRTVPENKFMILITFYSLWFSLTGYDNQHLLELDLPYDLEKIHLTADEGFPKCCICGENVAFIERIVINSSLYHRICLRCTFPNCFRQLHRGSCFQNLLTKKFECVNHLANAVLSGDKFSMLESPRRVENPPPRPPPPKLQNKSLSLSSEKTNSTTTKESNSSSTESDYIAQQIATAMMYQDAPPQDTKKGGTGISWEVIYPEALNPFSDTDDDGEGDAKTDSEKNKKQSEKTLDSTNPFDEDFDDSNNDSPEISFEEKNTDSSKNPFDEDDSEIEEKENDKSHIQSNLSGHQQITEEKLDDEKDSPVKRDVVEGRSEPSLISPIAIETKTEKEIHKADQIDEGAGQLTSPTLSNVSDTSQNDHSNKFAYIAPLPPMKYHKATKHDLNFSISSNNEIPSDTQQILNLIREVDAHLRKINNQMEEYEITGRRLETQAVRQLSTALDDDKSVWKSKVIDDYLHIIERRCDSLRMEALLVRRYMELFLVLTHSELDKQMKESSSPLNKSSGNSQYLELLVVLLEIKNELTKLDSDTSTEICLETPSSSQPSSVNRPEKFLRKAAKYKLKLLTKNFKH